MRFIRSAIRISSSDTSQIHAWKALTWEAGNFDSPSPLVIDKFTRRVGVLGVVRVVYEKHLLQLDVFERSLNVDKNPRLVQQRER